MNEEVLEDWTCGNDSMTSEMILKWAQNAWNSIDLPGIPKLEVTSSIKHSHIRVKFSGRITISTYERIDACIVGFV